MPLKTEYIDFETEIQSLREDMDDAAERFSQMNPEDTPDELIGRTLQEGRQCEKYINFLEDLTAGDVPGMPAMEGVELAGLTSGEVDLVDDVVNKHAATRRNVWVAVATRDGPYLEHDPSEQLTVGRVYETTRAVADLPRPYVEWAESKIGEYSYLGDELGNGFLTLASEKKQAGEN